MNYALIVAAGVGSRMNSDTPKQFMLVKKKPVLMHTIEAFHKFDPNIKILLVLSEQFIPYWNNLCSDFKLSIPCTIVIGGKTRFQSVKNGLNSITTDGLVAIHDGVRPCINASIIKESFSEAAQQGNAITAVKVKDSIRKINKDGSSISVDRNEYYLIQTPQTFQLSLIKQAYQVEEKPTFTDDASVYEQTFSNIKLIPGSYHNIKITTLEDLMIVQNSL